ncbi:pullulanase-type alpha-1,6-glucosidase [Paraferrimonas sp. SM1919]|uniref:pullulanase-type alpha-1,6-glucosidase n=1 Tax=Paraferrimonas sp. SM1919 TaxID=2662263 RepID=UPI0013CF7A1A|nr:pullulanase-type alpha-1,6-glucosidase [Paraferrimonas sp. SM1919]
MKRVSTLYKFTALTLAVFGLTACGGSDNEQQAVELLTCDVPMVPNSAGTECVDPKPIECPVPTVPDEKNEACIVGFDETAPEPVFKPGPNQAVLYYNNELTANEAGNPEYTRFELHTWNNDACDAYAAPFDATDWNNGHKIDGVDANYGAYWILELKDGYSDCANFIIHDGDEKALGNNDLKMPLMQDDERAVRMNWTFHGNSSVFEYPVVSLGTPPLSISGRSAYWLDADTILVNPENGFIASLQLIHAQNADITIDVDPDNITGGERVVLAQTSLTEEQQARVPGMQSWPAYSTGLTAEQAKAAAKGQLMVAGFDADNAPIYATYVQQAKLLDSLYTMGEDDADEAQLGVIYGDAGIELKLWAPTAQSVAVKLFDAAKNETASVALTEDAATGIWSTTLDASNDGLYYQYEVAVYHHETEQLQTLLTSDPYSVNVSTNGMYSQLVNLSSDETKPDGWDDHMVPTVNAPEDMVIYEGHVRDFSVRDESTTEANRGKYLAFTEQDSAPMQHLKTLADNGLTHFQVLPVNDISSIEEDESKRIELTSTFGELCAQIDNEELCAKHDQGSQIIDILTGLPSYDMHGSAQEIVEAMRGLDGFNWGYDPKHFFAPEGSYASSSEGVARVKELRSMNQSLHEIGLRVVLDVVYNHTSTSGLWDNSVLDKVVPGYYHRYNQAGGLERSTCCENTAPENKMMAKLMSDSLVHFAKEYGYDGFRFDIMGHIPKDAILAARDAVWAVDADNYFYGEGWNFGEVANNSLFVQAKQQDMAGTEVGTFNDRFRETIRRGHLFPVAINMENQDGEVKEAARDVDADIREQDNLRIAMAGSLQDYILMDANGNQAKATAFRWDSQETGYTLDPADTINYVSKHDNETLWDKLQYIMPFGLGMDERVRMQNIAATLPLVSQGIPFLQMGGDLIRSKSLDRNSYDAGDWFNYVDFTKATNNWDIGLPLAQDNQEKYAYMHTMNSNPYAKVGYAEIDFASNVFNELLSIRSQSPLLRLTTAQDIIDRVGFHNIGKNQTHGLIVMSIDDGADLADLDANLDAMVVVVNATANEQSHTVATAAGFELHATQQMSFDATVQSSSFSRDEDNDNGTFSVPAYTTAVFVKPQGLAQGYGLAADVTAGAPDVVPYGSTGVYLKGNLPEGVWNENIEFSYIGGGIYQVITQFNVGDNEFKFASADWSTVDFGGGSVSNFGEGDVVTMAPGGANLFFNAAKAGRYVVNVNAIDPAAPTISVYFEDLYADTTVYLKGDMNGWSNDINYALVHHVNGVYSTKASLTAGQTYQFKFADADWGPVNWGADNGMITLAAETELVSGAGNLSFTPDVDGDYTFVLDYSDRATPKAAVYNADPFAGTPIYLRGEMTSWGDVTDQFKLTESGFYRYSVTTTLAAQSYQFKFASADWSTNNIGAAGTVDVELGQAIAVAHGANPANLSIDVATAGSYTFTLSGFNKADMKLTVTQN